MQTERRGEGLRSGAAVLLWGAPGEMLPAPPRKGLEPGSPRGGRPWPCLPNSGLPGGWGCPFRGAKKTYPCPSHSHCPQASGGPPVERGGYESTPRAHHGVRPRGSNSLGALRSPPPPHSRPPASIPCLRGPRSGPSTPTQRPCSPTRTRLINLSTSCLRVSATPRTNSGRLRPPPCSLNWERQPAGWASEPTAQWRKLCT